MHPSECLVIALHMYVVKGHQKAIKLAVLLLILHLSLPFHNLRPMLSRFLSPMLFGLIIS